MKLLLISNSTNAGEEYLDHPKYVIKEFLGQLPVMGLFIPYAGVTFSYGEYEAQVKKKFNEVGHDVESIHTFDNPVRAVEKAKAIIAGGGNTFQLLKCIQQNNLIDPIREKVLSGTPFVGWSAGSNIACPTIRTTNDMPIVEPERLDALKLVNFQINPHYLDANPEGHAGETREMRIQEFLELNPEIFVVGLREGTMLLLENNDLKLIGPRSARIFFKGKDPAEYTPGENLNFLLA